MTKLQPSHLLAALLLLSPLALAAQNEASVQQAFIGHRVFLKIAMPGTQLGVDIYPQRPNPLASNYQNLLSQFPPAYNPGDPATITKVNYKKNHIEFQLDHGGFGQFGDNSDVSPVPFTPLPPSREEIDLHARIDHENDPRDRERERHLLDDLIRRRLEDDDRNRAAAQQATQNKIAFVANSRAHGGSRFNISYDKVIPEGLTPNDITAALDPYVSFSGPGGQSAPRQNYAPQQQQYNQGPPPQQNYQQNYQQNSTTYSIQKGMTFEQVHAATQTSPSNTTNKSTPYGTATTEDYPEGNNTLTVTYINGIVTQFIRTTH